MSDADYEKKPGKRLSLGFEVSTFTLTYLVKIEIEIETKIKFWPFNSLYTNIKFYPVETDT